MNVPDPQNVKRLLVRGTNWVGDAVMSIPALREIRRIFSRARISLLVRPWVRDVYSAADFVDELLNYDENGVHGGLRGHWRLASELRSAHFDLVILLQNAFEAAFHAWMARIPTRIGYARDGRSFLLTHAVEIDPEVRTVHQGYYYLGILAGVGLFHEKCWKTGFQLSTSIGVTDSDQEAGCRLLQARGIDPDETIIGLNPGAFYGGAKRWLSDRYAAVADAIGAEYGARIVIFGARNERRIADEVAAQMTRNAVVLAGETSLGQLMGLLKKCRLLITNDSGPMHLAAALDVPQVAIFGSSSEVATGPLSRRAVVVNQHVDCSPCFLRECPIDFRCMTEISVDRVISAVRRQLERGEKPELSGE